MGGDLRRALPHLILLKGGSALGSDQVAQSFVQSGLKNLQGWTLYHLSEIPLASGASPSQKWLRDVVHVSATDLSDCFESSCRIWHSQARGSSSHCFFMSHAFMLLFLPRTLVFPTPRLYYKDQSTILYSSPNPGWLCLLNSPGLHQLARGFLGCSIQKWIPLRPFQCQLVCLDCSKSVQSQWEGNKKC